MIKRRFHGVTLPVLVAFLVAGASASAAPSLSEVQGWGAPLSKSQVAAQSPRGSAIRAAALAYAAQAGMAAEIDRINKDLEDRASWYDQAFVFTPFMLPGMLFPPVIETADDAVSIAEDGRSVTSVRKSYRVIKQARFVSAVPTWRDYLKLQKGEWRAPDAALQPRDDIEAAVYKAAAAEGYEAGRQAASIAFRDKIAELRRDLRGVTFYYDMYLRGMVDPPRTAVMKRNVSGAGDVMNLSEKRTVISQDAVFVRDSGKWKAVVVSGGR